MGWNDFSLPAIGERHDNDDGTSRQAELALCRPGESVRLVREPDNAHDPMAVAIFSCRGVRVGYLKRDRAMWIGSKIDRGYDVRAIVERVKGSHLDGAPLGLVMRVNMEGDDPELISPSVRIPNRAVERAKIKSMVSDMVLYQVANILRRKYMCLADWCGCHPLRHLPSDYCGSS